MMDKPIRSDNLDEKEVYFLKFSVTESYINGQVVFLHKYFHDLELSEMVNDFLIKKSKNIKYNTNTTYEYTSVIYLSEEEAFYFTIKGVSINKKRVIQC